ncbi:TraR/DksA C4-type zinc finger protein [Paenibacillus sanguinis]|uniref:TraR/DksA C4-type zinc finger protein n=1 Tax=Paenibacillus sanguinis TaxID=225906 RepID=UPI0003760FCB|nr:TraR/DksA C4-type zinc finger protein [Paenibacillus sanguinis]
MTHLTATQLEQLAAKLTQARESLIHQEREDKSYGLESSLRDQTDELSVIDNHPADLGSEVYERGKDLALAEHQQLHLARIENALQRIANGDYGTCTVCGSPIKFERLEAIPETAYCLEHSPQTSVSASRPVEETVLAPSFGRTNLDDRDDQNGFDGEDTWQALERFGTSGVPAIIESSDMADYNELENESPTELEGFVEPYESFVATDIYGQHACFYRNHAYRQYMNEEEHLESEDSLE